MEIVRYLNLYAMFCVVLRTLSLCKAIKQSVVFWIGFSELLRTVLRYSRALEELRKHLHWNVGSSMSSLAYPKQSTVYQSFIHWLTRLNKLISFFCSRLWCISIINIVQLFWRLYYVVIFSLICVCYLRINASIIHPQARLDSLILFGQNGRNSNCESTTA